MFIALSAKLLVILVAEVISVLVAPVLKSVFLLAFMSSKILLKVVGGGKWMSCKFFEVELELVVLGFVNMTTKDLRWVGCPDETIHWWYATCCQNQVKGGGSRHWLSGSTLFK